MKNNLRVSFLLFFLMFVGYCHSLAQEASQQVQLITLYKGELKVIAVNIPRKVIISNPGVADVTSITKDEMLLVAKDAGTTNLAWSDDLGEHTARLEVFLENMSPVKERIDNILRQMDLSNVFTRALDSEAKVLLLGYVKTPQELERINVALSTLKNKIVNLIQVREEEAVVGIDVQVLELDKDATKTLGFSWPGSVTVTERNSPGIDSTGTRWGKLFKVFDVSREAFTLKIDALVQEGKARVLSQPQLFCQSGKEAELLVGGEKPIMTTQVAGLTVSATSVSTAGSTQVEYKEYGIKLKIKPTVTEDKKIKLALNVEVTELQDAEILGSDSNTTARAYPVTKRSASTELFLDDGQTMAIGGLKKQKTEEDIRKTPFLGDVPILGLLFRKRTTKAGGGQATRGDVELFITLTPNIAKEEIKKEAAKAEAIVPLKEEAKGEVATPKKEEAKVEASALKKEETKVKALSPKEKKKLAKEQKKAKIAAKKEKKAKAKAAAKEKKLGKEKAKVKAQEKPEPKGKAKAKAETAEYLCQLGIDFYRSGRYDEALIEFNKTLMLEPLNETANTYIKLLKESSKAASDYMRAVSQRIQDNFVYPWSAMGANLEGSLKLGIHLDYTGKLLGAEIRESSGSTVLDENALSAVRKVASYPAFPLEMKEKELWIDLPIIYKTK